MSFSDYIVAHCEADLKWMGPFHYPWRDSRNLSIRPAATPRGWCIPWILVLFNDGLLNLMMRLASQSVMNLCSKLRRH
ncbi:hypothetical protein ACRN98_11485, partial [Shewanella oncorhynchi]|uniref:hypothetical protein n=1 Tax=Shewanella oncorhynchi TaxID=2726434 RepID=UPI003D7B4CB8